MIRGDKKMVGGNVLMVWFYALVCFASGYGAVAVSEITLCDKDIARNFGVSQEVVQGTRSYLSAARTDGEVRKDAINRLSSSLLKEHIIVNRLSAIGGVPSITSNGVPLLYLSDILFETKAISPEIVKYMSSVHTFYRDLENVNRFLYVFGNYQKLDDQTFIRNMKILCGLAEKQGIRDSFVYNQLARLSTREQVNELAAYCTLFQENKLPEFIRALQASYVPSFRRFGLDVSYVIEELNTALQQSEFSSMDSALRNSTGLGQVIHTEFIFLYRFLMEINSGCSFLSGNDMCSTCEDLWARVADGLPGNKANLMGYHGKVFVAGLREYQSSRSKQRTAPSGNLVEFFLD